MRLGLKEKDIEYIINSLRKFSEVEKAVIFGSRAKGNYKIGSDIDLAIYGEKITFDVVSKIHYLLEDTGPLPYCVDVIDYSHLEHEELKKHIDRIGEVIYLK